MNTVNIYKDGKTSVIGKKWLPRFKADGWSTGVEEVAKEAPEKVSGDDIAALIELSESKDDLEALIKDAFNVDLDKRKSLDNLKSEALDLVNRNEG